MPINHDPLNAWLAVLREPLAPLEVAAQAWSGVLSECAANPQQAAIFFTGVIGDVLSTLPDPDPWRHLSGRLPAGVSVHGWFDVPDHTGAVGPNGRFGTWRDGTDLAPPTRTNPRLDASLVALSVDLPPLAAALLATCERAREAASTDLTAAPDPWAAAAAALRWAMWRRTVYVGPEDDTIDIAFLVWLGWSARLCSGGTISEEDRFTMLADSVLHNDRYSPIVDPATD